jgi:gamma-glutamylcyclotransferase (GGCT)/AIG2-like uncharacterized protein YtfP
VIDRKKVNLFIYGSLRDREVFQSVCGLSFARRASRIDAKTLYTEPALLPGYRRVSPDNVYYYGVKAPYSHIEGLVIYDVPASAMAEIDRYEGKRYERETVRVNTARGLVEAQAYLVSHESMRTHFGDRFHVNLIHELWLRKRIEKFLKKRTRPGDRTADAEIERQAERELLGTTERDLVISHYGRDAVSDYYLEHELDRPRPSIVGLRQDAQARPFMRNYLALVARQVMLNQLEEHIYDRFRFDLEHMRTSQRYFTRSVSLVAALQMINLNKETVDLVVRRCLATMSAERYDLIDYVKYAVRAARSMFDPRIAKSTLERIRSNLHPGLVPLGIELELSNLGAAAVQPQASQTKTADSVFDGFRYFYDYCLDVLCWKLGGYIDDHSACTEVARRTGFLELAPGRLNIAGELSRPATADPWLLNQLIHEIAEFYDVRPHSLHVSLQMRRNQVGRQVILPLGFVKCLLVLGGDPIQKPGAGMLISRMTHDEIIQRAYGEELVFCRSSKRNWYLAGDETTGKPPAQATAYVQQYKFIRLEKRANYEPLILCLKGLQLAYNPADYLTAEQMKRYPRLRREYEQLKHWAAEPTEINSKTIGRFVATVRSGLMNEGHHRPVHELHYIDWAIGTVENELRSFNRQLRQSMSRA